MHQEVTRALGQLPFINRPYTLLYPQKIEISKRITNIKRNQETRLYECVICDFKTKYYNSMSCHRMMHSSIYYECNQCDYKSKMVCRLKAHKVIHLNKKLKCDYDNCNVTLCNERSLESHREKSI